MTQSKDSTPSQPIVFFIFGGTGDLTSRKLIPALYNLFIDGWLPQHFSIIGLGRTNQTSDQFREALKADVTSFSRRKLGKEETWAEFAKHLEFLVSDIGADQTYVDIKKHIDTARDAWQEEPCVIYYLAVAPRFFGPIATQLAAHELASNSNRARIVIEKPFGVDLESALALNKLLTGIFDESQIYRIDHYLGKETVQNILAFRFANSILEPLWNRNYIDHVQISVTEQLGVGDRGGYYNDSGALRDMVQNHILQLLCLIAMEPPVSFQADEVRNRKVDVLHAMRKFHAEEIQRNAVRGQYSRGWIEGKEVPGYREEKGVDPESTRKHLQPSNSSLITGGGRACHFTCVPGSGCTNRRL